MANNLKKLLAAMLALGTLISLLSLRVLAVKGPDPHVYQYREPWRSWKSRLERDVMDTPLQAYLFTGSIRAEAPPIVCRVYRANFVNAVCRRLNLEEDRFDAAPAAHLQDSFRNGCRCDCATGDAGRLTVSKTVEGDVPTDQHFLFTVTLDLNAAPRGAYDVDAETGTAAFPARWSDACAGEEHPDAIAFTPENGGVTAQISLAHGEAVTISGIPAVTAYKVSEVDDGENLRYRGSTVAADLTEDFRYRPDSSGLKGVINGDETVAVTNSASFPEPEPELEEPHGEKRRHIVYPGSPAV